jgi:hypothetical protein
MLFFLKFSPEILNIAGYLSRCVGTHHRWRRKWDRCQSGNTISRLDSSYLAPWLCPTTCLYVGNCCGEDISRIFPSSIRPIQVLSSLSTMLHWVSIPGYNCVLFLFSRAMQTDGCYLGPFSPRQLFFARGPGCIVVYQQW